ncbi:MAG: hypothetical protein KAT32_04640 [Candidatus Moranbacteria bacterium]|nr:hypothetical protein [Candidatus Moranbacteria bacterium]
MELKEFLQIFIKYKKSFFGIILFFILGGITYFFIQPENYKASLTLNVSRGSKSNVDEYNYGDFYRLQADSRFADTVVRWLESPRVVQNILYNFSGQNSSFVFNDKQLRGFFSAKRMSSQVIDVTFIVSQKKDAKIISDDLKGIINSEAERLNEKQKQDGWFVVLGDEPVVSSDEKGWLFLLALTGMMGLFVGFVVVMFRHYWNEE